MIPEFSKRHNCLYMVTRHHHTHTDILGQLSLHSHIDGLVQDCSNSSALAMELLQSCTKPSTYSLRSTYQEDFKTCDVQDSDEGSALSLGAVQGFVDSADEPLEHAFVERLADGLHGVLHLVAKDCNYNGAEWINIKEMQFHCISALFVLNHGVRLIIGPGRFQWNFRLDEVSQMEMALRWMLLGFTDDKSTLV